MNIQMVDLQRQYQKIKSEIDLAIQNILSTSNYILGKQVQELEEALAQYLNVQFAIGCASGTDALQLAVMALDLKRGDEVITTPFTFVATTEAMALLGVVPIYVDIDERTYNIDVKKIEKAITKKTKAIMPVHLFGQPCEMDTINAIAKKHNLFVIEDNAQALGAEYGGKKVGGLSDISCTSFFPSKNLGCYGDGGMLFTNNEKLAQKIKMLANHGSRIRYKHEMLGINSRLDTIQAAVLLVKLKYLNEWNEARIRNAQLYNQKITPQNIVKPFVAQNRTHIFHQYCLCIPQRGALVDYLKEKKIPNAIYYPIPLHLQEAYCSLYPQQSKEGTFSITEKIAKNIIALPMHPDLTEEEISYIAEIINLFYKN